MPALARSLFRLQSLESVRNAWSSPFRGEIYEYGAGLDLQNGYAVRGMFDVHRTRYLIEPFKALRDSKIRQVVINKPVQTGGSLIADIWVPYLIEHDPGDLLWLFQDDDFCGSYMSERFMPLLKRTESLKPWIENTGRFAVQLKALLLPHMSVMIGGLNAGNVQSLSKRFIIVDECWLAESNGLISQAKDRATAFPYTSKILLISQAGIERDDFDLEWRSSSMHEWHWQCPACERHQPFEWSAKREDGSWAGMKWLTNETTRPNGRWDFPEVAKTARLECLHCHHQLEDTPAIRRRLADTGEYRATNPKADPTIAGYHWPSIANVDIPFAGLVTKYLSAKTEQEDHGYLLPLQQFYQKQLAIPWSLNTAADYHRVSSEPYEIHGDWKEEAFRFLTVDVQKDFTEFWYSVRAWSLPGESHQLARGRCESWEEVAGIQALWKVKDQHCAVDVGYEQTRVAEECIKHGHIGAVNNRKFWLCWLALKGARQEVYEHSDPKSGISDRRIYSSLAYLNPHVGKGRKGYHCPFFSWSNLNVKDILRRHRDGEVSKFLSLPDSSPPNDVWGYTAQMNSEIRVKERDEDGKLISIWRPIGRRPNHYWDCEAMQVAMAAICGIIGPSERKEIQRESSALAA